MKKMMKERGISKDHEIKERVLPKDLFINKSLSLNVLLNNGMESFNSNIKSL